MERAILVNQLSGILPSLPKNRGELLIWFDSAGPFDQLSAPFLWYRSGLQSVVDPPAPKVTEAVASRLLDRRPRYVVVIDGQEADAVAAATAVIARAPYTELWKRTLKSGETIAYVILLERKAGTWRDFPCDDPTSLIPIVCSQRMRF